MGPKHTHAHGETERARDRERLREMVNTPSCWNNCGWKSRRLVMISVQYKKGHRLNLQHWQSTHPSDHDKASWPQVAANARSSGYECASLVCDTLPGCLCHQNLNAILSRWMQHYNVNLFQQSKILEYIYFFKYHFPSCLFEKRTGHWKTFVLL